MELNTFPFDNLPGTVMKVGRMLSDMMEEMEVQLQTMGDMSVVANNSAEPNGQLAIIDGKVRVSLKLNPLANWSPEIKSWLGQYHAANWAKLDLRPNIYACLIMVEFDSGRANFYFTYRMEHKDGSLAHESPQGKLMYSAPYSKLAKRATSTKKKQPTEQASWL